MDVVRVEKWRVVEISLTSTEEYNNPFLAVDVRAEFRSESGRIITLWGFWDGGSSWKIRFAPAETGEWQYLTSASNTDDKGLHGIAGTISCVPYEGELAIYRHGFLKVGPKGRFLVYNDNTPFFWLGDTHWTFVTEERFDESNCPRYDSQFKACVDKRVAQKFNVYQCNFRDGKGFSVFGRYEEYLRETEKGYLPDIDFIRGNVDPKMRYLADRGLVIAAGYSWNSAIVPDGQLERYKLLARYLVARYGAYPVIWTLAGELPGYFGGEEEDKIIAYWREVALVTEQTDGYGALQSVHLATDRPFPAIYQGEPWYDFSMSQAGHGDMTLNAAMYSDYRELYPSMPLIESESLYEGIRSGECNGSRIITPDLFRRIAYLCIQNGGCGYTYGACGVWELQWEAAAPGTFWGNWGSLAWFDGLELPGANQLTIMKDFYESVGWHRLRPIPHLVKPGREMKNPEIRAHFAPSFTADEEMRTIVGYFASGRSVPVSIRTLTAESYAGYWFNPATGESVPIDGPIKPGGGCWTVPPKPGAGDRLVVLKAN